jgi:thioredoxin reductase (NADPH)
MSQYLIDQIEATAEHRRPDPHQIDKEVQRQRPSRDHHPERQVLAVTEQTVPADAIFIFIGAVPHSDIVAGLVARNSAGFILTGPDLMRDGRRPENWTLKR